MGKTTGRNTLYSYDTEEELQLAKEIHAKMYRHDQIVEHRIPRLQDISEKEVNQF